MQHLSKLLRRAPATLPAALLAVLVIVAIVAVVLYIQRNITGRDSDPGPIAAERYVLEYINALNANEPGLLSELVGRPVDSQDIRERLRLYGGRNLVNVNITIIQEFPYHYRVWITAQARDGSDIDMYQIVGWNGERWDMSPLYTGPPPPP